MSRPDIEAIRKRAEMATPGEWINVDGSIASPTGWVGATPNEEENEATADFIAHARDDIPTLLAYIEELEVAVQQWMNLYGGEIGSQ